MKTQLNKHIQLRSSRCNLKENDLLLGYRPFNILKENYLVYLIFLVLYQLYLIE